MVKKAELPARRLFQAAGLIAALGVLAAFGWFNYAWSDQTNAINDFRALPPRSGIPMEITEAGTYTVWAGAACGGLCDVPPRADFYDHMILGFEGPDGMIRPEPFPGHENYRVSGNRHGKAVWLVEFNTPGSYVVERKNQGVGSALLLLGRGEGLPSPIITGVLIIGGVALAGSLSLAVAGWRIRRRALADMVARVQAL